jgi:nicotinate phosphoribosyltransferase
MALGQSELDAFRAYAELYPDDCLLLVDTIDTLESGIPNAIRVFEELKRKGHRPNGVRLDSGDLAYLSIQVARRLNDAGFSDVNIVLSNQLDELVLWQILTQIEQDAADYGVDPEALINRLVYGVGTSLIASNGHSALDGVYKMVALQDGGEWKPAIKISENPDKVSNPGEKAVWRVYDQRGKATADVLGLASEQPDPQDSLLLRHPTDHSAYRRLPPSKISGIEPLLIDVLREGRLVYDCPAIAEIRQQREADLERLDSGVQRIVNPHIYHVSLTQKLWDLKQDLIRSV